MRALLNASKSESKALTSKSRKNPGVFSIALVSIRAPATTFLLCFGLCQVALLNFVSCMLCMASVSVPDSPEIFGGETNIRKEKEREMMKKLICFSFPFFFSILQNLVFSIKLSKLLLCIDIASFFSFKSGK